jgi:hypothetical protein
MSVTVDLPEELLDALRAEADQRGVSIDVVIAESLSEHLGPAPRRQMAIFAVGASGGRRGRAAEADELLADGFGSD